MSNILILGAKGNLGSQLEKEMSGHEVTAWDQEEIDISDKELVFKKMRELRPGLVINAAAYNKVDKCEEDDVEYELARRINCQAPLYLAQACLEIGATFIHYSSDYVFDGQSFEGYIETDEPAPINRYGKTKAEGERGVVGLSGQGLKWYLVRTSKLFGPPAPNTDAKPGFFDLMLTLAKERDSLDVVESEVSCFTYTPDLAKATRLLWEYRKPFGIYHLANTGAVSWYEAARYLFDMAGLKVKLNPVSPEAFPRPAKRPCYSELKNTKTEPLRIWQEALREYLVKNFKA
jgi:dTDP-4-dehydrorhamnose reductase